MNKGILISGNRSTGKTSIIKSFTNENYTVWINGRTDFIGSNFAFSDCRYNTEFLVIDDYIFNEKSYFKICDIISVGLEVNKKMKASFFIKPKVVVVVDSDLFLIDTNKLNRHFDIYELKKCHLTN